MSLKMMWFAIMLLEPATATQGQTVAIHVSTDGATWGAPVTSGSFPKGKGECRVMLTESATRERAYRYVKLVALTPHNPQHIYASIAEFAVIPTEETE